MDRGHILAQLIEADFYFIFVFIPTETYRCIRNKQRIDFFFPQKFSNIMFGIIKIRLSCQG
jgi:hypothetical protein